MSRLLCHPAAMGGVSRGREDSWEARGDVSGPVRIPKVLRNNTEAYMLSKFIFLMDFHDFLIY